jgi:predicted lipoprotein with Yx(FWY)xxD motif
MLCTPTSTTERVRRGHRGDPFPGQAPEHPRRRHAGLALLGVGVALGAAVLLVSAGVAGAKGSPVVLATARGSLGKVLVTSSGATLYRYTPDGTAGKATCTGGCASLWPPLTVPAGTTAPKGGPGVGKLGTTAAAHGVRVVTYHGMPLYRYAPDSGTSTQGQGIGGIWFVVHPSSAATTTPTTAKAPSSGY